MVKIFHNKRCSKSCAAIDLLEKKGIKLEVQEYLVQVPRKQELRDLLQKLNMSPLELIRKGESIFQQQYKNEQLTDEQWLQVMLDNPILIERPIVVNGNRAVIGRPVERILELFQDADNIASEKE